MNLFELGAYAYEHTDQIKAAAAEASKGAAVILAAVTTFAAILAPQLPPPTKPDGLYAQFRKLVNYAAHNYHYAKNAN